jgi:hypothetical protein
MTLPPWLAIVLGGIGAGALVGLFLYAVVTLARGGNR